VVCAFETVSVSETGTITPAKEIELNFNGSGQLTRLNVKVGDQVMPDQVLGEIDTTNLLIKQQEAAANLNVSLANVKQAQSTYDSARRDYDRANASLSETLKQAEKTKNDLEDTGPSTVTTYEQAIVTAESNLATTKTTYQRSIDNKYDSLQLTIENKLSAVTTALDAVNRVKTDENLKPTFSVKNSAVLNSLNNSYDAARDLLITANAKLTIAKMGRNQGALFAAYDAAQNVASKTFNTLNFCFSALENSIPNTYYSQAQIDAAKATIDGHTTTISSAISALQTARQSYDDARLAYDTNVLAAEQSVSQARVSYNNAVISARNAVSTAKSNKDQQLASAQSRIDSASSALSISQAQVGQAQASLALISNQLSDNSLRSPIKGIITKINYEVGEQVSAQKALVSVLTENNYQIEVDISETDISKMKLNNSADITLDALGPEIKFQGKVYFIEPAATIIQGVTYYKVKVSFDPGTQPVKPGMTASAVIQTNKRENVLIMPARAVVEKDNTQIARILQADNTVRESTVNIGLNGDDGLVEVLSGVNEGDKVVTFIKDSSKK
jgi:RND family efflux transporter MFP subunit